FCDRCKRQGHTKDKCYKLHGYPQGSNQGPQQYKQNPQGYNNNTRFNKGRNAMANAVTNVETREELNHQEETQGMSLSREQYGQIVNLLQHFQMGNTADNPASANIADLWILDSGASHHMTFNKTHLQNITYLPYPVLVKLPNGYKVKVTEIGDVILTPKIVLYRVLFVPSFKFNLVSISSLAINLRCIASLSDTSCLL
ncbi:hypothetical protein A4A49_59384, partial [Nicotiana attenuata]